MNVADSEVVASILSDSGYKLTDTIIMLNLYLLTPVSIRENAEQRVWGRLDFIKNFKRKKPEIVVGVIGVCRKTKEKLIETDNCGFSCCLMPTGSSFLLQKQSREIKESCSVIQGKRHMPTYPL